MQIALKCPLPKGVWGLGSCGISNLQVLLKNNVLSLSSVIDLCRKMRKFEVLVYTSTAYSNCNHLNFPLKEEVYRLPFHAGKFLDALKNEDKEKLQELFAHCKPDWPNFYSFSKCLAENLLTDTASDLPVAIIRPSIVFSTWKNPIPGYVEENSGIITVFIGNDSEDMSEHINEFFMLVDKLREIEIEIANDLLTILLLYSIPESYENFRIAIESRDELPSPETLKIKIIEEANARKNKEIPTFPTHNELSTPRKRSMSVTSKTEVANVDGRRNRNNKQKFKLKCNYCGIFGHKGSICRKSKKIKI
ncbi:Fatty acyl-CoA reductase 1 [Araneus ventricosus]|uniref:Fatty acyl-CoA reductase n=1 Tax=Araneus ventricosus TaxID=182803 RepID=A0A4Y2EP82_ARAVE|nr:Fatty acyl-CoA reductase 1 [Araneus ventricosus]